MGKQGDHAPRRDVPVAGQRWRSARESDPVRGELASFFPGDLIVGGSILILLIEMVKAARLSRRSIIDHILSMVLFVAMLIEFLLVPQAGTATFLLLLVISFVDVTGGFAVSIRAAQRDISFSGADSAHSM